MRPGQESGVYTFMNLPPLTSIIEGGGLQGPSPFAVLMIFLCCNRCLWSKTKMQAEPCNSESVGGNSCGSVAARRTILFLTFLPPLLLNDPASPGFSGLLTPAFGRCRSRALALGLARAASDARLRPYRRGLQMHDFENAFSGRKLFMLSADKELNQCDIRDLLLPRLIRRRSGIASIFEQLFDRESV